MPITMTTKLEAALSRLRDADAITSAPVVHDMTIPNSDAPMIAAHQERHAAIDEVCAIIRAKSTGDA